MAAFSLESQYVNTGSYQQENESDSLDLAAPTPAAKPKKSAKSKYSETQDIDVLRKYLRIVEEQLEISEVNKEELSLENSRLQNENKEMIVQNHELEHKRAELTKKIRSLEDEIIRKEKEYQKELEQLELAGKVATEKLRGLEERLNDANEKNENLRVRVRKDIRKIRENERDLEARLELLRKDSQTLMQARDQKVLELQRKIDALEFDLDQVQDGRVQAQMESERYLGKLSRVARALQIGISMIEDDHSGEEELDELEPEIMGGAAKPVDIQSAKPAAAVGAEPVMAELNLESNQPVAEQKLAVGGEDFSADLEALAHDGEPTQMIVQEQETVEEEPSSH